MSKSTDSPPAPNLVFLPRMMIEDVPGTWGTQVARTYANAVWTPSKDFGSIEESTAEGGRGVESGDGRIVTVILMRLKGAVRLGEGPASWHR